jgi:hypothetical protein
MIPPSARVNPNGRRDKKSDRKPGNQNTTEPIGSVDKMEALEKKGGISEYAVPIGSVESSVLTITE